MTAWQAVRATRAEAQRGPATRRGRRRPSGRPRYSATTPSRANESLRKLAAEQRRTLYDVSMNLAQAAWEGDDPGRTFALLRQQIPQPGEEDLRGFEWHYWDRLAHRDLKTVRLAGFGDGDRPGALGEVERRRHARRRVRHEPGRRDDRAQALGRGDGERPLERRRRRRCDPLRVPEFQRRRPAARRQPDPGHRQHAGDRGRWNCTCGTPPRASRSMPATFRAATTSPARPSRPTARVVAFMLSGPRDKARQRAERAAAARRRGNLPLPHAGPVLPKRAQPCAQCGRPTDSRASSRKGRKPARRRRR